jgi:hypothetical protein
VDTQVLNQKKGRNNLLDEHFKEIEEGRDTVRAAA